MNDDQTLGAATRAGQLTLPLSNLKLKILKDTAVLNAALIAAQALTIVQTLIVMRFLDPALYGLWLGLTILLTYGSYVHLGIEHGMAARLLYHQGSGNPVRVVEIQHTAYTAWTLLAVLFATGVLVAALLLPTLAPFQRWGLLGVTALIVLEQQVAFLGRWETSFRKNFGLYSTSNVLRAVLSFVFVVPLAYVYGVAGVILGTVAVSGAMVVFWWSRTAYHARIRISPDALWEVCRIGFPIFLVVLGGVLIETIDRLLILNFLGIASLGYYGITAIGGSAVYRLLSQAGSTTGPHMVEQMGRSGQAPESLREYLVKPTLLLAYAAVVLIAALVVVLPEIVHSVLPRYEPGLPAFYLFVPGFFFLSITLTANNILNLVLIAQRRQRLVVYLQALVIAIEVVTALSFIALGWGIAGVALSSTIAYAVYGIAVLWMAARYVIDEPRAQWRFTASVIAPFVYTLTVTLFIVWIGFRVDSWTARSRLALQALLLFVAGLPLLYSLDKQIDLRREMQPLADSFRGWLGALR
jgi:O-antigen/teichoic acid export membrane protein